MALDDMHDDEVRARLGLAPLGRPMTMEERIEFNMVRAVPEPFDPDTEAALELTDLTRGSALPEGREAFRRRSLTGAVQQQPCPGCGMPLRAEYENHVCPGPGEAPRAETWPEG